MIRLPYILAAVLALSAAAYGLGRVHGRDAEAARNAAAVEALEDRLAVQSEVTRKQAAKIEADRQAQEALAQEIENEARADGPVRVPAPGSLQRLRSRWGATASP